MAPVTSMDNTILHSSYVFSLFLLEKLNENFTNKNSERTEIRLSILDTIRWKERKKSKERI